MEETGYSLFHIASKTSDTRAFHIANALSKQLLIGAYFFFFFFRIFPSVVATANFPSPGVPIFCFLLRHITLFHHIHKPPFWPSTFPLSSQLHILSILLPIYTHHLSSVYTCPYHLSLASRIFSPNRPICAVPLMY